ncbi:hypothetical protein PMIN04_005537 [Paraphaeosphaeria minitans]
MVRHDIDSMLKQEKGLNVQKIVIYVHRTIAHGYLWRSTILIFDCIAAVSKPAADLEIPQYYNITTNVENYVAGEYCQCLVIHPVVVQDIALEQDLEITFPCLDSLLEGRCQASLGPKPICISYGGMCIDADAP